ncbi:MAG: hypothetical protein NVSMB1_21950 [Polyangiales bacterium]
MAVGQHGALVNTGSFVGPSSEARYGEVVLDVDTHQKSARIVSAVNHLVEELPAVEPSVEREVERMIACFAPESETKVAHLSAPLLRRDADAWVPILDAALRKRFPSADALLYEAWGYAGITKTDLPAGPVTPQSLFDLTYPEKQRSGGPGFTAFVGVDISGRALRDLCTATLYRHAWKHMHRVCPNDSTIHNNQTYRLVIERRSLMAPHMAFTNPPPSLLKATTPVTEPSEAFEVLLDYAVARGKACVALDRDERVACIAAPKRTEGLLSSK